MQFELDAEVLRQALANGFMGIQAATVLADLGAQLPPELPTKPYAIIQSDGVLYLLADKEAPDYQWIGGSQAKHWDWIAARDLPRQFTVISEGLDL